MQGFGDELEMDVGQLFWINRLSFLRDIGLYHLHAWVTHQQPGSDNYLINFYVSALLSLLILSLFHLRPLCYGVLLPSMPGVAHLLQDGHLVPLVDLPPQSLTRKVSFIYIQDIDIDIPHTSTCPLVCPSVTIFTPSKAHAIPFLGVGIRIYKKNLDSGFSEKISEKFWITRSRGPQDFYYSFNI